MSSQDVNKNMIIIGSLKHQPQGFKAFIPDKFPPQSGFSFPHHILSKASKATRLLGKLDGITQLLPDVDFFLFMYIRKDAASSSQIEGTKATMIQAIEAEANTSDRLPEDVEDIIHYISALNYGLERFQNIPLSARLICDVHKELMRGARASHFSDPGYFRKSQNWIGGTKPSDALFVPPPVEEMKRAFSDLEKFMNLEKNILPIIRAGLIHAQFETIHPFLDGNGRTGRILITLYLWKEGLIEKPVLFLSWFFKKHQSLYYDRLQSYHQNDVNAWLDFFLEGVCEVSEESIEIVKKINQLREEDLFKIHNLGKKASESAVSILPKLFKLPIVNVPVIQKWTGFTRPGAQKVIDRFIALGILEQKDENKTYGRSYIYRRYTDIFNEH